MSNICRATNSLATPFKNLICSLPLNGEVTRFNGKVMRIALPFFAALGLATALYFCFKRVKALSPPKPESTLRKML